MADEKSTTPYKDAHRNLVNVLAEFDSLFALKDTLAKASDAEGMIATAEAHLADVQTATEVAMADCTKWEDLVKEKGAEFDGHLELWAEKLAARQHEVGEQIAQAESDRDAAIAACEASVAQAKKGKLLALDVLDQSILERQGTLNAIEQQIVTAQGHLDNLKAAVGGIA